MPDSKGTVLAVDDDPGALEALAEALSTLQFRVWGATDGGSALALAQRHQPDVILLDVMMPGMDGFKVLTKLRQAERTRYIPVVMLTARGESKSIFKAQDLGVSDYLIKPCESKELLDVVSRHTAHRHKFTPG